MTLVGCSQLDTAVSCMASVTCPAVTRYSYYNTWLQYNHFYGIVKGMTYACSESVRSGKTNTHDALQPQCIAQYV
jgi:hypothetical protein